MMMMMMMMMIVVWDEQSHFKSFSQPALFVLLNNSDPFAMADRDDDCQRTVYSDKDDDDDDDWW